MGKEQLQRLILCMEIPRHWRVKKQRYNLEGLRIIKKDGTFEYQFPPKANLNLRNSNLLPPNDQIIHGEIVRKNQEQHNKGQN